MRAQADDVSVRISVGLGRLGRLGVLRVLCALGAVAACSRTPPEPAPATTSSPTASASSATSASPKASASADAARCITSLPEKAPPVPAPAPAAKCPADPEPGARLATAEVGLPDAPGKPRVKVELALSEAQIQKGLMYRREMAEDAGMLFRLEGRSVHTFWMHNTCLPLDMMFVDEDGVIVGIVESAEPVTDTTRSVGCPSRYVLEVNAGYARRHGVQPGQRLGLPAAVR
jgi:uncharacterized membrane protein (UPF0127 family)